MTGVARRPRPSNGCGKGTRRQGSSGRSLGAWRAGAAPQALHRTRDAQPARGAGWWSPERPRSSPRSARGSGSRRRRRRRRTAAPPRRTSPPTSDARGRERPRRATRTAPRAPRGRLCRSSPSRRQAEGSSTTVATIRYGANVSCPMLTANQEWSAMKSRTGEEPGQRTPAEPAGQPVTVRRAACRTRSAPARPSALGTAGVAPRRQHDLRFGSRPVRLRLPSPP